MSLERRVRSLEEDLARLRQRLECLEGAARDGSEAPPQAAPAVAADAPAAAVEVSAAPGRASALLARLATVCFVLAVALVLRTLTDNQLVGPGVGIWLGVGYACLLILGGGLLYRKAHSQRATLSVCGTLLLAAVLVEGHRRLGLLSPAVSYGCLAGGTLLAAGVGLAHGAAAPVWAAVLAAIAAGVGLRYPEFAGPHLALVLFGVSAVALAAGRIVGGQVLRVLVTLVLVLFWVIWGGELNTVLVRGVVSPADLPVGSFLALLALTALATLGWSAAELVVRRSRDPFHAVSPTVTVVWSLAVAVLVVQPLTGTLFPLGAVGCLLGAILLTTALLGARRGAAAPLAAAGSAALVGALPPVVGPALAVPLLAALAWAQTVLSRRLGSAGLRLVSAGAVVAVASMALVTGAYGVGGSGLGWVAVCAGAAALVAAAQYRWARSHPPDGEPQNGGGWADRLDRSDDTAVAALLAALLFLFLGVRLGLYALTAGADEWFLCTQTMVISLGAVCLIWVAVRRRNSEFRIVGILVIAAGGLKVFVLDLLTASGLPLVAGVLAFGVSAAVCAVLLRRWGEDHEAGDSN